MYRLSEDEEDGASHRAWTQALVSPSTLKHRNPNSMLSLSLQSCLAGVLNPKPRPRPLTETLLALERHPLTPPPRDTHPTTPPTLSLPTTPSTPSAKLLA